MALTILLGAWRLGDTLASRVGLTRLAKVPRAFRVGTGNRYQVFGSVPGGSTEYSGRYQSIVPKPDLTVSLGGRSYKLG